MAPKAQKKTLGDALRNAGKRALGGGLAGAIAMVVQVLALMWMRTTINYQHAKGMSTLEAMTVLYAAGGIARFYQGMAAALLQGPLSRFGDTAANAGALALLEDTTLPEGVKTFCASLSAALFRILITPIDTLKTTLQVQHTPRPLPPPHSPLRLARARGHSVLDDDHNPIPNPNANPNQVQGTAGMAILSDRLAKEGIFTLWSGALGSSVATLMGHYPWFLTYNFLQGKVPKMSGVAGQFRSAIIGFISSFTSDVISNSVRP